MTPKHATAPLVAAICLLTGCAGSYSVVETSVRSHIPPPYKDHTGGIIAKPGPADIQTAVAFGGACKEDADTLLYAYLWKGATSPLATDSIYVKVATPLYLIAKHAQEQAKQYRKPDDTFVEFVANLGVVRLSVSQQYLSSNTWRMYAFNRELILLRDGVRVEPLSEIAAWNGTNPVLDLDQATDAVAKIQQDSLRRTQAIAAQYAAMYGAGVQSGRATTIPLNASDAVFRAEDLAKPGVYEIVFREPHVGMFGTVTQNEVRFPIRFDGFM